ncbi:MAG: ATP-binding protein [Candidatus Bathyarchaeia archaeon]|jgi:predicted kinase
MSRRACGPVVPRRVECAYGRIGPLSFRQKLWNIVLSGYPGSGKTVLARRLVSENPTFVRLSVDDVRSMFYGTAAPSDEEDFVYKCLASYRDFALRSGHNVILDSTAPQNSMREFLLKTKVEDVVRLLVVMIVSKTEVDRRNQERNLIGASDAYDKAWEEPLKKMPVLKFRNEDQASFDTSYYLLTELLRSNVSPYLKRFMEHIFPRTRARDSKT